MPTQADFDRHRESLLRKMAPSHLDWYPVKLAGSGEVLVSKPVRIDVKGLAPVWDEQPLKPHPKALKLAGLTK